jgi:hypothetical protein
VRRHLSITDFFSHFRSEYSSARKALRDAIVQSFVIGVVVAFIFQVYVKRHLNVTFDGSAIVVFWVTSSTIGWAKLFYAQWRNLPLNVLNDAYKDMTKRSPELVGLINSSVYSALAETHFHLLRLALQGDDKWTPDTRFAIATSLIEGFRRVRHYYATSTDVPYRTLDIARQFYAVSEEVFRTATVQRLLVLPRATLLTDLEQHDQDRKNLLAFIELHHHHGTSWDQQPTGYQLRYWPSDIPTLRANMRRKFKIKTDESDEDKPVLVDMAVVEERRVFARAGRQLVFGQAGLENDKLEVSGPGMVHGGPFKAAQYRGWFTHVWQTLEGDCESAAQLAYWAKLFGLREEIGRRHANGAGEHGETFLKSVLSILASATSLCAVDIAETTTAWYEDSLYIAFHDAMKKSAEAHANGRHARIFVLPHELPNWAAEGFVERVLVTLLATGRVEVFLYRKKDLVHYDLAAGDHIVADDSCFYLAPGEGFGAQNIDHFSEARNKAKGDNELRIFRDQFSKLADRNLAWQYFFGKEALDSSEDRQRLKVQLVRHV